MCVRSKLGLGLLTQPKSFGHEFHGDECGKHDVELVVAGEYTTPGLESAKWPLNLVTMPIPLLVQYLRLLALRIGRHHRNEAELLGKFVRGLPS